MQFSVEIPDGNSGTILLWRAIPKRAGKSNAITATGRPLGKGDYFAPTTFDSTNITMALYNSDDNLRYRIGRTRAIQPGRNKPGVWYRKIRRGIDNPRIEYEYLHESKEYEILCSHGYDNGLTRLQWGKQAGFRPARNRITSLEKLDVRQMTDKQARRTGFASAGEYLNWWARQYDRRVNLDPVEIRMEVTNNVHRYTPKLEKLSILLQHRPAELYTMLYIGFEFVTP